MIERARRRDYVTIAEQPGQGATRQQLSMLYTRYELASRYATGKCVLEVGCGAGIGLGLLSARAQLVVGGDIEQANCRTAAQTCSDDPRIVVGRLDAECLPFRDGSFDTVILFEALYYLREAKAFFREARRVLRPGGTLVLSTVNCRWHGFNPSPFSTVYYDNLALAGALDEQGFRVKTYLGFPDAPHGVLDSAVALARRFAVRLRLIPRTMKGKEFLKRLFYGELQSIPRQIGKAIQFVEPILDTANGLPCLQNYKMLYAIGSIPPPADERREGGLKNSKLSS